MALSENNGECYRELLLTVALDECECVLNVVSILGDSRDYTFFVDV